MMYTLDLLRGQHLPKKASYRVIGSIVAAYAFFVVLFFTVLSTYVHDKGSIAANKELLESVEQKTAGLKSQVESAEVIVSSSEITVASLKEVSDVVSWQMQWSDLLVLMSSKMPKSLIVEQMRVKVRGENITVAKRNEPTKKVSVSRPNRTLTIDLYGLASRDTDKSIRDFQKILIGQNSSRGTVKDVVIAVREPDKLDGYDIIRYQLNLTFNQGGS
ncbi:MAG: hypothetical protein FVQ79_06245 [Planctomycetes bacterium]|nr:hypothetical protein [Planctomycetota bacterium]